VNVLHEDALVLEDVTLRFLVQGVISCQRGPREKTRVVCGRNTTHSQMLIDLACFSVLPQQPSQNPLSSHPLHLGGETSFSSTLSLTRTSVATLAFSGKKVTGAGTGVDNSGLYDDTTVFNEFLDMRAGVGIPDLSLLSRVEPDFALANTGDGCGESLLRTKVDHSGV
jgi:hypothetical protein